MQFQQGGQWSCSPHFYLDWLWRARCMGCHVGQMGLLPLVKFLMSVYEVRVSYHGYWIHLTCLMDILVYLNLRICLWVWYSIFLQNLWAVSTLSRNIYEHWITWADLGFIWWSISINFTIQYNYWNVQRIAAFERFSGSNVIRPSWVQINNSEAIIYRAEKKPGKKELLIYQGNEWKMGPDQSLPR